MAQQQMGQVHGQAAQTMSPVKSHAVEDDGMIEYSAPIIHERSRSSSVQSVSIPQSESTSPLVHTRVQSPPEPAVFSPPAQVISHAPAHTQMTAPKPVHAQAEAP